MSARAHFKIAGIPVHVQPVFWVIAGLFGLRFVEGDLYLINRVIVEGGLDVVGLWILCTFVSILVHELGHGICFKVFGRPSAIVLHAFGGVTMSRSGPRLTRAKDIGVSLAGSLTGLVLLGIPMRVLSTSDWILDQPAAVVWVVYFLEFQNIWWSILNLLPIRPLDGGNVAASLFGIETSRRLSIVTAIGLAVFAFANGYGYAAFFALFLAFNNWQEIRAEQVGSHVDAFDVDAPDAGSGSSGRRGRGRSGNPLQSVPAGPTAGRSDPQLDPARMEQAAWAALRSNDGASAKALVARLGPGAGRYLQASLALVTGSKDAFELFEAAYVAEPNGPPNLTATEVLARAGAATAVAKRLVGRADGRGRDGANSLQTHLHYAERFAEAAEVGEVVFAAGPSSPAQTAFETACSWARAQQVDRAVEWLERAGDAGFKAASLVDGEPDLAAVRADPRWPLVRARLV